MTSVSNPGVVTPFKRFRRPSSDAGSSEECSTKKPKYFYILAPITTTDDDSEAESIYSVQECITDFAKDTSDTSDDSDFVVEYEVPSDSDCQQQIYPFQTDSSSSPEDVREKVALDLVVEKSSSDVSCEDSPDEREKPKDCRKMFYFRKCAQCDKKNLTPLFPFCFNCFKMRKNFFPPRPKRRKKVQCKKNKDVNSSESAGPSDIVPDKAATSKDCGTSEVCGTCLSRPKDGAFVHKNIIHVYSCFKCSEKTYRRSGRCPICNVHVQKVCKIIA